MKIMYLVFTIVMLLTDNALSNNIQVSNVRLTGQNTTDDFTMVEFDITWENSWRYANGPANWDAAWIFIKFKVGAGGVWQHAWLNNTGHVSCGATTLTNGLLTPGAAFNSMTNPVMGTFLYRSVPGNGTFDCQNVQLRWNYGANGIADNAVIEVQVFAVEFVYIPPGSFSVGSGGIENYAFYTYPNSNTPYPINAENVMIVVGPNNGNLYYAAAPPVGGDQSGPVPPDYPKGFNAFYAMKYEVSQTAYADFLNTLTRAQQTTRVASNINNTFVDFEYVMSNTSNPSFRNGISCRSTIPPLPGPVEFFCDLSNNAIPNESTDGLGIACNFISYGDLAAYLDWAALRLMTEFEFEKCSRGLSTPIVNEYAWGNNIVYPHVGLLNSGQITEAPIDYIANLTSTSSQGPLRNGAFARSTSNRTTSGAGYYGCMELSGNLYERCVTIGNAQGRSYTGLHGNGALTVIGNQDVGNWPAASDAIGIGFRGSSWDIVLDYVRISDRSQAATASTSRLLGYGGRGVRTAE